MDVDIDKLIDAVEVLHSLNNNKEDAEKHITKEREGKKED